jgi:chromosome segregation ATPase
VAEFLQEQAVVAEAGARIRQEDLRRQLGELREAAARHELQAAEAVRRVEEAEARAQKVLSERGEAATEADRREEQLRVSLQQRGRQLQELEAHSEVERAATSEVDARMRSLQQDKSALKETLQETTRDVEDLKTLLRAALGKERQEEALLKKLADVVAEQKVMVCKLENREELSKNQIGEKASEIESLTGLLRGLRRNATKEGTDNATITFNRRQSLGFGSIARKPSDN